MVKRILILLAAFALGAGIGILAPGYRPPEPPHLPALAPAAPAAEPAPEAILHDRPGA